MDDYSSKRAMDGLVVSRKGSGLVMRDTANNRYQNAQFCNRLGCSGRLNSTKGGTHNGYSEKPKSRGPSFRSLSGKEIIGSSSRTCSAVSSPRKSFRESRKKLPSQLETDSSESSSIQDEREVSELIPPCREIQKGLHPAPVDAEVGEVTSMEVGSSNIASSTRPRRDLHKRSGLGNQDLLASSVSLASKSSCQGVRHGANPSKYGLRNLRCNSIADVVPSGCSSSDLSLNRRKDLVKKRNSEGESSSSAKGKKMSGPSLADGRKSSSNHGISISDSRRARNWAPSRDNAVASVRARRSINGNPRARLSHQGNGNGLSLNGSPVVISQMTQPEVTINVNAPSSSHQISAENHSSRPNSNNRPGNTGENLCSRMPVSPEEGGITRSLMNRDNLRHYNMDGIAEVLFALERIEQDEELTYEVANLLVFNFSRLAIFFLTLLLVLQQLLILETNLFLNGLSFHDQHRDMRLDIDNMSYEELLALEERMGNVSTALTEETVAKCLKRSIYETTPPEVGTMGFGREDDDVKCSICQEEYVVGDEVGRLLQCEHRYHVVCIHQWLRLKNWCPVCKTCAASSLSSSQPS
ncbi:hypothetical protein L1049_013518 [Liquidambar formosana]|uniref:RING-type E3 ubiquitin transferase n=1 Tax=Liquidambar formosana TaxID=63359 RepID=A0AAP0WWX4_LIQFO